MALRDENTSESLADALGELARKHEARPGEPDAAAPLDRAGEEEIAMTDTTADPRDADGSPDAPAPGPHDAQPQALAGQEASAPGPADAAEGPAAPPEAAGEPSAVMRTRLREFGERFGAGICPVVEPIRAAASAVAAGAGDWRGPAVLPALRELAHQVQVLCEKVARQQAYVLIFGPLKSGKSTFMNAVCSAYVSEVTSLPAYPCIVNVSHGDEPGYTLTCYDGSTRELTDPTELRSILDAAHRDLTARIRQVEADGADFDPALHLPSAVRRIDVRLPTGDLADSGAVLVDTPGLYSRMKFGYDQMTRDFRHAAACAIFIVKTDNLFLEQVFEEFQELLELFSRVFLIVNLDITKRDLAPDGRLVPSLEGQDPRRIIEAFRDLSLSAPLKAAADAGRLRIYPVDLLHAASERIRRREGRPDDAPDQAPVALPRGAEHFEALLTDLTDYLNSSEYLREFLQDSLRRAESLLAELGDLAGHDELTGLRGLAESWQQQRAEAGAQLDALGRLAQVPWADRAAALRSRLRTAVEHHVAAARQETEKLLAAEVHRWFETDAALSDLTHETLAPLSAEARRRCEAFCREEMHRHLAPAGGGLDLGAETLGDLRTAEVDLDALARAAEEALPASPSAAEPAPPFRTDQIPVRRSLWDWLLLRSRRKVRRRLLGPPERPDLPIAPAVKARRLGQAAEEAMIALAESQAAGLLVEVAEKTPDQLVEAYVDALAGSLKELFAARDRMLRRRIEDLDVRLAEAGRVLEQVAALSAEAARARSAVEALADEFAPPPAEEGMEEELHDLVPPAPEETEEDALLPAVDPAESGEDYDAGPCRLDLAEPAEPAELDAAAAAEPQAVDLPLDAPLGAEEGEIRLAESLLESLDGTADDAAARAPEEVGSYRAVPEEPAEAAPPGRGGDEAPVLRPVGEEGEESDTSEAPPAPPAP